MLRVSGECGDAATNATPAAESDSDFTLASENPHEWFYKTAIEVAGKDAGQFLHTITGYPASSCYAYVAHDKSRRRRPPEHFLRALLRSDEGERFYRAFMDGCTAPWWLESERHRRNGKRLEELEFE